MHGNRQAPAPAPRMLLLLFVFQLGGPAISAEQQPEAKPEGGKEETRPTLVERNQKLIRDLRSLGPWTEQAKLIQQANRNVFEHYGWASEEDRFALKLAGDVARIPPWDFMGRFDFAFGVFTERYQLDAQQIAQIKPKILWRTMRLMGRHVATLFDLSEEFLAARLERRAFTPAEVARWSRMSKPLMLDAQAQFTELCREVEPLLTARQRELLARDRAADERRAKQLLAKLDDWQQGKWQPADWGLQDDPYHGGRSGGPQPGSGLGPAERHALEPREPQYDPADEDAWAKYVRDFIRQYRLDHEQVTAARAILQDVRTQAQVHRSAISREVGGSPLAERIVRINVRWFDELKRRLDQVPSDKQRRAAEELPPRSVAGNHTAPATPSPTTAPAEGH